MDIGAIIVLIGILIFVSHFFAWLFSYTKVPNALLLMLVGLLLGPVLGLLSPTYFGDSGNLLVTIVLVMVLFQSGLGLKFSTLKEAWRTTILLSLVSFVATAGIVCVVLWLLFNMELLLALMVGVILGGTSSAVVVPMLKQLTMGDETRAVLTLESVFSDVLVIVIAIALLEAYRAGQFSVGIVALHIIGSFLGAGVAGFVVAIVWARILGLVKHMKESLFTTPALVFLLFGLTEWLGFSGPIAVLVFGVFLGNVGRLNSYLEQHHRFWRYLLWSTPLSKRERLFFAEGVFVLQTFFFVFVGLSLHFYQWELLIVGLALVVLMALVRLLIVRLVAPRDIAVRDAIVMAVMIPKGLAAAALATMPLAAGVAAAEFIQGLVYAVILFSVMVTSLLIFAVNKTNLAGKYTAMLGGFDLTQEEPRLG